MIEHIFLPIYETLTDITTPVQSGTESNSKERELFSIIIPTTAKVFFFLTRSRLQVSLNSKGLGIFCQKSNLKNRVGKII